MHKIAKVLTNYVIQKGTVKENEREIYEYGFLIFFETSLCLMICFGISVALRTIPESILFFAIFIPLRSYAGGLHLNKYWACFSLSCLTFVIIMILGKYLKLPILILLVAFLILEIAVYSMYPVENVNRVVDVEEDKQFKKRLQQVLLIDSIIAIIFAAVGRSTYLQTITMTLLMVTITMAIGKCKNKKQFSESNYTD